jgi:hypothetical protein
MPRLNAFCESRKAPSELMRRTQPKLKRRPFPAAPRVETIADVKKAFDLSDLELTDAYNEYYGTGLPCPLPEKFAPRAVTAARTMRMAAEESL